MRESAAPRAATARNEGALAAWIHGRRAWASLARRWLSFELEIGVMLPCNVIVYERDGGGATVAAIDPSQTLAAPDPRLTEIAAEVHQRLTRVIDRL